MPDLCESVGLTNRFIEQLKTSHLKVLKGILRDIKGTMDHIILMINKKRNNKSDIVAFGYSGSNWG